MENSMMRGLRLVNNKQEISFFSFPLDKGFAA